MRVHFSQSDGLQTQSVPVSPSGAMTPPEGCYPQLFIKQESNSNHMKNNKQTEQKPKKANSEIRKQQNRIASRNYRMPPYSQSRS
jgi:hypothetical protein